MIEDRFLPQQNVNLDTRRCQLQQASKLGLKAVMLPNRNFTSPQPSKNALVQPPSHQLFGQNILTPAPVALMLSVQRLHSRTHAAHGPPAPPATDVLRRRRRRGSSSRGQAARLRDEGGAADGRGERVLLLLLLVGWQDERVAGDV